MNISQLRVFLVVAEHLNLSHAADTLGITQPALSRLMARLQSDLDVQLYVRKGRGIALTEAGSVLRRRAQDVVERLDETVALVSDMRVGVTGHVRLGVGPAFLSIVADAIGALEVSPPHVRYTIREGTTQELFEWVKIREIDFALLGWIQPEADEIGFDAALNWKRLLVDDLVIVTREHHPLQQAKPRALSDLAAYHWILPRTSTKLDRELQRRFRNAGLPPPSASVLTSSLFATLAILRRTNHLALMTRSSLSEQDMPGIRALDQPWMELRREAFLITLRGMQLPAPVVALIDKIRRLL
ncbi:LysR family transcriptional regulator [Neorhizobium sp. LjRoot104]|uniref:LysR family transcriptional regulator n=1 Tax=Neorhizobium sp. LjRoot104 TaxID=3342254 RepID=UPI003ED0FD87